MVEVLVPVPVVSVPVPPPGLIGVVGMQLAKIKQLATDTIKISLSVFIKLNLSVINFMN